MRSKGTKSSKYLECNVQRGETMQLGRGVRVWPRRALFLKLRYRSY